MTTDEMSPDEKEKCAIALDEALTMCGGNESLFNQIATMMGIRKEELSSVMPLETKYRGILAIGPGNGKVPNTRWVLARAWQLVVEEGMGALDAIDQGWEEAEEKVAPQEESGVPGLVDEFPGGK